ncbi:hypothetical protein [Halovibrio sp. HP20-50]|jgi:hypothetical protein|uniref:hypothetical protein n=1 Tax=Halovibrio sp. HP20-59 TaxID=3080275 RepID=UPI00294ACAE2|nr:hypothetical protein [Halovibrio sp. HP20-59]MEA2118796.1 hypothetical protein [Halovibrio sp. HP20-59]
MSEWTCDVCGGPIKGVEDGWVEWLSGNDGDKDRSLRLVHNRPSSPRANGCQYDGTLEYRKSGSTVADRDLGFFSSQDGLMQLLEFISLDRFAEKEEVLQMIKRLHVPGYEKAYRHLDHAVQEGVFEPDGPRNYPDQYQIKLTNEWLDSQR